VNEVFKELTGAKSPKYIHVCGGNGVGKTTFIQEIGRMCVERGLFENGVYIMDGKEIEEKHQSDFEAYIYKKSETGTIFNLQAFNKYGNENFLLIIDDFHLIRPRSNGRYNIFLNRLLEKKVNIILATYESFNVKETFQSVVFKTIKIEKLNEIELNIYAYNIFDLSNKNIINDYEEQKKAKKMTLSEISKISEKHRLNKSPSLMPMKVEESLKKIVSNRN
jgi:ABC-type cobalamin/Fe3+-siderophores transport system ATPase subunit